MISQICIALSPVIVYNVITPKFKISKVLNYELKPVGYDRKRLCLPLWKRGLTGLFLLSFCINIVQKKKAIPSGVVFFFPERP